MHDIAGRSKDYDGKNCIQHSMSLIVTLILEILAIP